MGRKRLMKPPKEDENILRLPTHITLEILSRLPAETVIGCGRVCKAWRSVVLDPCFSQIHLARSPLSLMFCCMWGDCWSFELEKGFSSRERKIPNWNRNETIVNGNKNFCKGLLNGDRRLSAVSSCNGLLCIAVTYPPYEDEVYVWNPINDDCVALPIPNSKVGNKWCSLGLGFCPRTNVYKVIRVVGEYGMRLARECSFTTTCEIFTFGTNAWRIIQDVPLPHYDNFISNMPFNGGFHWICISSDINDENFPIWICAFRIEGEKWDSILVPPNFQFTDLEQPYDTVLLQVVENCLVILDRINNSLINIWMMKEYGVRESWTKCWSIQVGRSSFYLPRLVPLKLTKDGKLLIFDTCMNTLVCFDPRTGKLRKRRINCLSISSGIGIAYVPSFLSPTEIMKGSVKS